MNDMEIIEELLSRIEKLARMVGERDEQILNLADENADMKRRYENETTALLAKITSLESGDFKTVTCKHK